MHAAPTDMHPLVSDLREFLMPVDRHIDFKRPLEAGRTLDSCHKLATLSLRR